MRSASPARSGGSPREAPAPIARAIATWQRQHKSRNPRASILADLRRRWSVIVGETWGRQSRPRAWRAGTLAIEVSSSAALQEMKTLRAGEILTRIQIAEPRVTTLRFAVGDEGSPGDG